MFTRTLLTLASVVCLWGQKAEVQPNRFDESKKKLEINQIKEKPGMAWWWLAGVMESDLDLSVGAAAREKGFEALKAALVVHNPAAAQKAMKGIEDAQARINRAYQFGLDRASNVPLYAERARESEEGSSAGCMTQSEYDAAIAFVYAFQDRVQAGQKIPEAQKQIWVSAVRLLGGNEKDQYYTYVFRKVSSVWLPDLTAVR